MYTQVDGLFPSDGNPTFNQLYIYQRSQANALRMKNHTAISGAKEGCTSEVMEVISEVLENHNPYVFQYKTMAEKYNEENALAAAQGRAPSVVRMYMRTGADRRR